MYYIEKLSEQPLTGITVDEAKLYIGVTSDDENLLISRLLNAAADYAEVLTGNIFRHSVVRIIANSRAIRLPGKVINLQSLKVDGVDVQGVVTGNLLTVNVHGVLTVDYETEEWLPQGVAAFILQSTAEMYSRGSEIIVNPNIALLSKFVNVAVC